MKTIRLVLKARIRVWPLHGWLEPLTVASILILALVSRTYMLGDFPYFPPDFPWLGDRSGPAGLYGDEAGYLIHAKNLFNKTTTYQPWLHLVLIHLSLRTFGESSFAARLPGALASALTAVVVYFAARLRYGRGAAALSSIYFIAMVPALVYGRMVFLENMVALLFILSVYFMFRYDAFGIRRWLYLSGFFAGLSMLAKINGLVVPVFFVLWLLLYRRREGVWRAFLFMLLPVLAGFLALLLVRSFSQADLLALLQGFMRQWLVGSVGRELSSWQYLFLASMPSGYIPMLYSGYLRPECWFLFAYFCIAYVAVREAAKVLEVILALAVFVGVLYLIWGISSYYMLIVYPLMALPVGRGIQKLLKMPPTALLGFLILVYAPLLAMWLGWMAGGPTFNAALYALKLILFGAPFISAALLHAFSVDGRARLAVNLTALIAFFALLLIGSYVYPVLYPHYFNVHA